MSAAKKKIVGKRYSADEKSEIIAFIEKHNEQNGRGGQTAAAAQYGVSALTLSAWLKASGAETPTGKKRGRKPGSKNKINSDKVVTVKGGNYSKKLSILSALAQQIDTTEAHLDKLKTKFNTLKKNL